MPRRFAAGDIVNPHEIQSVIVPSWAADPDEYMRGETEREEARPFLVSPLLAEPVPLGEPATLGERVFLAIVVFAGTLGFAAAMWWMG